MVAFYCLASTFQTPTDRNGFRLRLEQLDAKMQTLRAYRIFDQHRAYQLIRINRLIDADNVEIEMQLRDRISRTIYDVALKYDNLSIELICATIAHESGHTWNPDVVSPATAIGLMQILPSTGRLLATQVGLHPDSIEQILFDPELNIQLGCRYLSYLIQKYSLDGGLAAYNGGEFRAAKWLQRNRADGILAQETAGYVPAILELHRQYQSIQGVVNL